PPHDSCILVSGRGDTQPRHYGAPPESPPRPPVRRLDHGAVCVGGPDWPDPEARMGRYRQPPFPLPPLPHTAWRWPTARPAQKTPGHGARQHGSVVALDPSPGDEL